MTWRASIYPLAMDDEDHYALNWAVGVPVSLKAGVPQQVTLRYQCEEGAKPGTYDASLYYFDDSYKRVYVQIPPPVPGQHGSSR